MSSSRPQSREYSRPRSHPRDSRHASTHSVPYLPQGPDALLLPEGSVSEEAVELLHEFVHPHQHQRDKRRADTEDTVVAETILVESEQDVDVRVEGVYSESDDEANEEEDGDALKKRPWYRRPSPLWLLCVTPLSSIAMSATIAPRVEIYTYLACLEHKPEYTTGSLLNSTDLYGSYGLVSSTFTDKDDFRLNGSIPLPPQPRSIFAAGGESINVLIESKDTNKCASDPVVQAAAAKIIAVMTTTMGILSCLTTAFWGSLSDRYGRLRVLGISVIGVLFDDFIFIFVYFCSKKLPGGYWFLLLGPIVEGILGGQTSMSAASHAYLADCSSPGTRSQIFSLGLGLLFVGMAFGPTIGAVLIHLTQTPLSVFYLGAGAHSLFALYMWCVVPESLSKRTRSANRRRLERGRVEEREREERESRGQGEGRMNCVRMLGRVKRVFKFLSPLSVFAPEKIPSAPGAYLGKRRRDWSLTFIAASYGCAALVFASYQYKFQYAAATFGWTSEELGYWLSLVGASRAVYLTAILPLIIKLFNHPKPAIQLPIEPFEPLNVSHPSEPSSSTLIPSASSSPTPSNKPHAPTSQHTSASLSPHSLTFDLRLARASLALEGICFMLIPLSQSAVVFTVLGCFTAWGGGFNPAVSALALDLYARRGGGTREEEDRRKKNGEGREAETGRLFGAMSVVQVMCSQIFGPALFGLTYMRTVARFPSAIFWVSTLCVSIALVFICFVRLPRDSESMHVNGEVNVDLEGTSELGLDRERTLVDVDISEEGR